MPNLAAAVGGRLSSLRGRCRRLVFLLRARYFGEDSIMEDAVARFSQIKWPDMALISFRTERGAEVDDFVVELVGLYSEVGTKFELRFEDATYLRLDIDFASKRTTSDALDGARCRSDSPWKTSLSKSNPYDNFSSYLHYEIGLVPKGGIINLLARDFALRRL